MILTRAPLRISLAGGGTDLPHHYEKYNGAVCSLAINKYVYVIAKTPSRLFPHNYRLVYSNVEKTQTTEEISHPLMRSILRHHSVSRADVDLMSDVPAGTGLGSSSACAIALHLALSSGAYTKQGLAELACKTEIEDLKEPIGKQDQYASAYGGINLFEFTKNKTYVSPLDGSQDLMDSLHLLYLGNERSASSILKDQVERNNTHILSQMTSLAYVTASYIRMREYDGIGEVLKRGWELKKQLSPYISNDRVESMIEEAYRAGATGVKLLGAGGTGFLLAYVPIKSRYAFQKWSQSYNTNFTVDQEGAKILYDGR